MLIRKLMGSKEMVLVVRIPRLFYSGKGGFLRVGRDKNCFFMAICHCGRSTGTLATKET